MHFQIHKFTSAVALPDRGIHHVVTETRLLQQILDAAERASVVVSGVTVCSCRQGPICLVHLPGIRAKFGIHPFLLLEKGPARSKGDVGRGAETVMEVTVDTGFGKV